jgi:hypothetical protein
MPGVGSPGCYWGKTMIREKREMVNRKGKIAASGAPFMIED